MALNCWFKSGSDHWGPCSSPEPSPMYSLSSLPPTSSPEPSPMHFLSVYRHPPAALRRPRDPAPPSPSVAWPAWLLTSPGPAPPSPMPKPSSPAGNRTSASPATKTAATSPLPAPRTVRRPAKSPRGKSLCLPQRWLVLHPAQRERLGVGTAASSRRCLEAQWPTPTRDCSWWRRLPPSSRRKGFTSSETKGCIYAIPTPKQRMTKLLLSDLCWYISFWRLWIVLKSCVRSCTARFGSCLWPHFPGLGKQQHQVLPGDRRSMCTSICSEYEVQLNSSFNTT